MYERVGLYFVCMNMWARFMCVRRFGGYFVSFHVKVGYLGGHEGDLRGMRIRVL